MIILSTESLPFLSGLVKLVTLELSNNQINLHQSLLLCRQVQISFQLLRYSLSEFVPVQVSNQLLEVVLVNLVSFLESIHV